LTRCLVSHWGKYDGKQDVIQGGFLLPGKAVLPSQDMKITSVRDDNGRQAFKSDVLGDTECYTPPGFKEVVHVGESWDVDYYRTNDNVTQKSLPYLQSKSMQKQA